MLLMPHYRFASFFLIMALRTVLFVWAGCMMLKFTPSNRTAGRRLAGWSLIAWGVYVLLFPFFFQFPSLIHPAFGFLVGFHVLAALGLVVMVVDRVRVRAEDSEDHARRLEGFLPICSHCKKIRDDNDIWQPIESYIRDRSDAEFSHGICPECLKMHYPEFNFKT
jgi:K+-sensing histidine kinase KdpD